MCVFIPMINVLAPHLCRVSPLPSRICQIKSLAQWPPRSNASQVSKRPTGNAAEAEAPADKDRIVAEAHYEFTKAVTDPGLSLEEYASILE
jgi:hypothetical protein